ncbi:MAG TPA: biotin/lipoyl-containing protein, partial [Kofleriaceae bacterium]
MADLVVPQLGESISEAVVAKWLKQVGDAVADGEPVAELETDKITVELPSPVAGALSEQRFAVGATVKVGDVIGAVEAGKAGKAAPAKAAAQSKPAAQPQASASSQAASSQAASSQPAAQPKAAAQPAAAKQPAAKQPAAK